MRLVVSSIQLSNNSVRGGSTNWLYIEQQLCKCYPTTEFALQLDESTLHDNEALHMIYVRCIHNGVSKEEMLFLKSLETDTRGQTIFMVVNIFVKRRTYQ